jgi:hypothetical protein
VTREFVPLTATIQLYSMDNVKADMLVIKKGRASGVTVDILNALRTMVTKGSSGKKVKFTVWHIAP